MNFEFMTVFLNHILAVFPERASVLLLALFFVSLLGFLYGGWKGKALPFYWLVLDSIFNGFCFKAFKQNKERNSLVFRGIAVTIGVIAISALFGVLALNIEDGFYLYGIPSIILLSTVLSVGSHWHMMGSIHKTIKDKKNGNGYFSVAASSRVDLNNVDDSGVIRAASNFSLVSFERMVIIPSLGYLFAGLIGAFVLSGLGYVMWRLGRYGMGKGSVAFASGILRLLSIIVAPVTLFILSISCLFVPHTHIIRGIKGAVTSKNYILGFASQAMKMVLSGPSKDIDGWSIKQEWIGSDKVSAKMDVDMIRNVRYLLFIATIVWSAVIVGALLAYKTTLL